MDFQEQGFLDKVFEHANEHLAKHPGQYEKFVTTIGTLIQIGLKRTKITTRISNLNYSLGISGVQFKTQGKRGSFVYGGMVYYWGETFIATDTENAKDEIS